MSFKIYIVAVLINSITILPFSIIATAQDFAADYVLNVQEVDGKAHYNGVFPGPVMRVSPGDYLDVELVNSLPALNDDCTADVNGPHGLNTTNLHPHGLHVSPDYDSSGEFLSDNVFVALVPEDQQVDCANNHGHSAHSNFIKGRAQYRFELPANHMSGTFWYHAHKHGSTAPQVGDGLAGPLIVEDQPGELPSYIEQANEKILLISDKGLHLANEQGGGMLNPTITLAPGEVQRWRFINATSEGGEVYQLPRLSLKGLDVYQIAFDGFTLDRRIPIDLENHETPWLNPAAMASGNRMDLIVRAPLNYQAESNDAKFTGDSILARILGDESIGSALDIIVRVTGESKDMLWSDDDTLPGPGLQPFYDKILPKREIAFTEDETIDGKSYTGNVEQSMLLGTAEEWTIRNGTDELHIYHIHVNPFFVTHINGKALPADSPLRRWQDTIGTPTDGGAVTFKTRFERFTGKYVIHCHVLEHEDEGMMQIVEVAQK